MYFPSTLLTEALDRGLTVEPEMRSVVIVAVQEVGELVEALGVLVVGADVGPLAQQDADEGLGLAVGLGPVRAGGAGVYGPGAGGLGEDPGAGAGAVVGQGP